MKANERRNAIINALMSVKRAIPGYELSARFGVSRQIIVKDISILKAAGYDILPTHTGYRLRTSPMAERVFKVCHSTEQTADELMRIISLGGTVGDVFVQHRVYGKIEAILNISTPEEVEQFISGVRTGKSVELMNITGGYHYHTVRAETEEDLDKIAEAISAYLVHEEA